MNSYKSCRVFLEGEKVGTLAVTPDYRVAFEYNTEWMLHGFSISPLSLPLKQGVFLPKRYDPFEGLFGVFADSLPDGWGRLLVDRFLLKNQINPAEVDSINRLTIVGSAGMGALSYLPENTMSSGLSDMDLDKIAIECKKMWNHNAGDETPSV